MNHHSQRKKGADRLKQPKRVIVLCDNTGNTRDREPPPEISSAMDFGKTMGWDMILPSYWQNQVPDGVHPDGLIALCGGSYKEIVERWYPKATCGVVIDAPYQSHGPRPYPVIKADYRMIGDKAADYFIERGFRNFATVYYQQDFTFPAMGEFAERVRTNGFVCHSILCGGPEVGNSVAAQAHAVKSQLVELPLPLALFCVTDRVAVRVCRWCQELGLAVPNQVAVLGIGNDLMACNYGSVPISSIELAPRQRGLEAARILNTMMEGSPPPGEIVLVPVGGIVTRRSTDILAVNDVNVARALRYIWDHYRENIGIDDIAAFCGVSSRFLIHHFRNELNRTIIQELTRFRMDKACELLATSEKSIIDIAALAGFRSPQHFNKRFNQLFKIAPRQYRKKELKERRPGDAARSGT